MRLFLSSYRAGNYPGKLAELYGKNTEVAVITNAKDYKSEAERQASVNDILGFLSSISMKSVELDLRGYFGQQPESLENELRSYQALWMAGGNTFVLRRALAYSGADRLLYDMVRKNEIIYGGESAGAIMATPTFTGVEFGDDPNIVPVGYKKEVSRNGLNFIGYHIVPHYQSDWEGSDAMVSELNRAKLEYKTLTNNQAILIRGGEEVFLG